MFRHRTSWLLAHASAPSSASQPPWSGTSRGGPSQKSGHPHLSCLPWCVLVASHFLYSAQVGSAYSWGSSSIGRTHERLDVPSPPLSATLSSSAPNKWLGKQGIWKRKSLASASKNKWVNYTYSISIRYRTVLVSEPVGSKGFLQGTWSILLRFYSVRNDLRAYLESWTNLFLCCSMESFDYC